MNERAISKRTNEKYKLGARRLEKVIERDCGIHIPHNRIHQHLLKEGLAKEESKKKKRRKPYIRYEREHTLSAWHSDWYDTGFNNTLFFDCYNRYRGDFESWNAFIEWYNTVRPRCLGTKWYLQTPEVAFWRRLPVEARVGAWRLKCSGDENDEKKVAGGCGEIKVFI